MLTTAFIPPPVTPVVVPAVSKILLTGGVLGGAAAGAKAGAILGPKGAIAGAVFGAGAALLLAPAPARAPERGPFKPLDPGLNDSEPSPEPQPEPPPDKTYPIPLPPDHVPGTTYRWEVQVQEERTDPAHRACYDGSLIFGGGGNVLGRVDTYANFAEEVQFELTKGYRIYTCGGQNIIENYVRDNFFFVGFTNGQQVFKKSFTGYNYIIKQGPTYQNETTYQWHNILSIKKDAVDIPSPYPQPEIPTKPRPEPVPIEPLPVPAPEPAPTPVPEPEPEPEPIITPSPNTPNAPPVTIPKAPPGQPKTPTRRRVTPIPVPVEPNTAPIITPLPIPQVPTVPEPAPDPGTTPAPSPQPGPGPGPVPQPEPIVPGEPSPNPSPSPTDPDPGTTPSPGPQPGPVIPLPSTPVIPGTPSVPLLPSDPQNTAPDGNLVPRPDPKPITTPKDNHYPIKGGDPVTPGGTRTTVDAIAKEVGRIEQKTAQMGNAVNQIPWPLLGLIYELLQALTPEEEIPGDTYTLTGVCEAPDDDGNQPVFSTPVVGGDPFTAMLSRIDSMQYLLQAHLGYKTPTCKSRPELKGDWRTISFISDEKSPYGKSRIRKRLRYRSESGTELSGLIDYWAAFVWQAGPVCVQHSGSSVGTPQVWAASADEGKRVLRHAFGETGIDPDQVGQWTISGSNNPRYGVSGTMRVNKTGGFYWITERLGSDGRPEVGLT